MQKNTSKSWVGIGCVLFFFFLLAFHFSGIGQQTSSKKKAARPVSLRICKDADSGYRTFKRQVGAAIVDEAVRLESDDPCQQVDVMTNDPTFVTSVAGIGDPKFKKEHPVAFEVSIVDAKCEKQCVDKASGWVSSYELPSEMWPSEEEWLAARTNSVSLNGHVAAMAAANRVARNINKTEGLTPQQRQDRYQEAMKTYNAGVLVLQNYGF